MLPVKGLTYETSETVSRMSENAVRVAICSLLFYCCRHLVWRATQGHGRQEILRPQPSALHFIRRHNRAQEIRPSVRLPALDSFNPSDEMLTTVVCCCNIPVKILDNIQGYVTLMHMLSTFCYFPLL